jgi:hypothetical protein
MGTKSSWTLERRMKQAELIKLTKPWSKSTGPKTPGGKAISARNAYAGDEIAIARAKLKNARIVALAVFGRQRWPKRKPGGL